VIHLFNEKELKPIVEASYLTTTNAWRYRSILRFFYNQHERLRHYLFPEEIYDYLKQSSYFQEYTEEQLQQDLNQLVEWKNIIPRQETGKVNTIEDFKKKKFRYQCTPYTIEFERMIQGLEQIGEAFGGSLERTLFDRLLESLLKLTDVQPSFMEDHEEEKKYKLVKWTNEEIHTVWEEMYDHFRKLTENATDYLAYLKSEKVEEAMMTESFLAFKDVLTQYLRDFMTTLQRTSFRIEAILEDTPHSFIEQVVERLVQHQLSIPRLDEQPDVEELKIRFIDQWKGLQRWFIGMNGRESELSFLQNETNETIRRMTRFAQRLGEKHHNFRSRRKDYLHLANWFHDFEDIKEAHQLSACVFGLFHTRHLFAETKETEDIDTEMWEHSPTVLTLKPRIKQYREKTRPGAVVSRKREKDKMLQHYLLEKEAEQKLIEEMITNDKIILSDLPLIDPYVRKTILHWIGKCMSNRDGEAKTETGRRIRLLQLNEGRITLRAEDGVLDMPNYVFTFID
jgi:uncharacterized protein (TIGR02677 family)